MRMTVKLILAIGQILISAVVISIPIAANAQLFDTIEGGGFPNYQHWAANYGPYTTLAAVERGAIAFCLQNEDYVNPAIDCTVKHPSYIYPYIYENGNGYYYASISLNRNNGMSGKIYAVWSTYVNVDSTCPVGQMIDPDLGYGCIDPGFRLAEDVQSPKDCGQVTNNESNPCDPANGNKSQREVDYSGLGDGSLIFARYYNSQGANKTAPDLGAGWRHTYSRAIDQPPDRLLTVRPAAPPSTSSFYATAADACAGGWDDIKTTVWSGDLAAGTSTYVGGNRCEISVGGAAIAKFPIRTNPSAWNGILPAADTKTLIRHNGAKVYFDFDGSNWINEFNPALSLETSGSNWIYTDSNDTKETYDASGKLVAIGYRNGQSEILDYDLTAAQGGDDDGDTLDRVTGPFGHTLTFAYDESNRLTAVVTPDGAVQYTYGQFENIELVTYPDSTGRQYHYEDVTWPNHLTGITDENTDRYATWAYDAEGRAILSEHAGAKEQVQFAYNADGTTTLTMGNGAVRHYDYSTQQGMRKLSMLSGDVCSTCPGGDIAIRTFDSNGFLYETADWNGNTTRTIRNSRGLTETLIEGFGSSDAQTTTTVWHANFRLPTSVNSPQNSTAYTYDTDGNVLTITVSAGGLSRGWAFTYNADGQPLTINGPRTDVADVTTLEYFTCTTGNECGQLKKVTNALGHVTNYDSYDSAGRLLQMTVPNGLQTSLTYDSRGRVLTATQTPPVGTARITTMTYDNVGQLLTMTLPDSSVLTYVYDAAHYLTSVTDSLGNYISYNYDAMGQLTDEDTYDSTATLKRALDYALDLNYRLDAVTDGGFTTGLTYDLVGNLTDEMDPNSNVTQHTYDALNRLDTTIDALTGVVDFDYDDHDNLTQVVAAYGATTAYVYDSLDNLQSESSPDRGVTNYTYDAAGNRLAATDARSVTATYTYDVLNRLTSVSFPDSTENVVYAYDDVASNGVGRLTSISDQSGTTTFTYDDFGSVATDSRHLSGVTYATSYQYDAAGNVSSVTYPSGRTVDYGRDTAGQITQVTSTKSGVVKNIVTSASYEPFGPIEGLTYGNGLNFDYQHRADYRTSNILSTGVVDKAYTYDAAGNIIGLTDAIDSAFDQEFAFDVLNRLSSEGILITQTYDATVLANGPIGYWRLGEASGTVAADASGNGQDGTYVNTVTLGAAGHVVGSDTALSIDTYGSGYVDGPTLTGTTVTGIEAWFEANASASVYIRPLVSLHNSNYNRAILAHGADGTAGLYRDKTGFLLMSDGVVSINEPHHMAVWYEAGSNETYLMIDGVLQQDTYTGNLLAISNPLVDIAALRYNSRVYPRYRGSIDEVAIYDGTVTASTFLRHFLAAAGPGGTGNNFVYDANGNRTSVTDSTGTASYGYQPMSNQLTSIDSAAVARDAAGNQIADASGTRAYGYDDSNRLYEVFDNGILTANYIHNALGQRTRKTVGSTETVYIYDLNGGLLAEHDGTGTLIRDYVRLNGTPVAQIELGEVVSYLHFDHLGTPRQATDDSQAIVWRWNGDAFGSALPDQDPDANGTSVTVNLRFPGQYYDQESGLHYNYFRTYDPSTGRYLESDPVGLQGGLNTYGYVNANPLSYTDPTGETPAHAARAAWGVGRLGGRGFNWAWAAATGTSFGAWLYDATHDGYDPNAPTTPPLIPPVMPPESLPFPIPLTDPMTMDGEQCEEDDDNCEALYQSILQTCAGLSGKKKFRCFEAARIARDQCYQERGR